MRQLGQWIRKCECDHSAMYAALQQIIVNFRTILQQPVWADGCHGQSHCPHESLQPPPGWQFQWQLQQPRNTILNTPVIKLFSAPCNGDIFISLKFTFTKNGWGANSPKITPCVFSLKLACKPFLLLGDEPNFLRNHPPRHLVKVNYSEMGLRP